MMISTRIGRGSKRSPVWSAASSWEAQGLRGPSATWTYLVGDQPFGANLFRTLANRASIGLWGVLLLWPVLFAWGLYLRWKRRRP